jgi:serine/threonine-protein kinase
LTRGLAAAHSAGVVHGNLTPRHLRVTAGGALKILGFGMAASSTVGRYTAPERVRGEPATASGDIFSAGAVLYELACGRPAFPEPDPGRLVESILACRPIRASALNPRIDSRLEHVIMRALARRPSRRFARAADVADALESQSLMIGG